MTNQQKFCLVLYFALLIICVALFILSDMLSLEARTTVISIAADGFKLVIGAIVGTLSAIIGVTNQSRSN